MPGDEDNNTLQTLLTIQAMISGVDNALAIHFDKSVLDDLIETSLKFQEKQEQDKPKQKTGRRAAIEAQKERKRSVRVGDYRPGEEHFR